MARDPGTNLRREAKNTQKIAGQLLARHGKKLADEDREKVRAGLDTLARAAAANDAGQVRAALDDVERLYQLHLHRYRKSTLREYVESIGWAVVVALLLRAFVIEAFKIPSGSMIPTLLVGDHIFVNKFVYGLRIPFTYFKFWEFQRPERGDVIVFIKPDEPDKDYIKRVVGLGGDTVELRGGELYVNDKLQPREARGEFSFPEYDEYSAGWTDSKNRLYTETLGRVTHDILIRYSWLPSRDGVYTVKEGTLFVMGDNRDNSQDSRMWGLVPLDHVKGKAMFIWLSAGGPECGGTPWPFAWFKSGCFRFGRLFTWIR